jgi:hypothetical protein
VQLAVQVAAAVVMMGQAQVRADQALAGKVLPEAMGLTMVFIAVLLAVAAVQVLSVAMQFTLAVLLEMAAQERLVLLLAHQ